MYVYMFSICRYVCEKLVLSRGTTRKIGAIDQLEKSKLIFKYFEARKLEELLRNGRLDLQRGIVWIKDAREDSIDAVQC